MSFFYHIPVLLDEVLSLVPPDGQILLDFTLGLGGHSQAILKKYRHYKLIGFDQDEASLNLASKKLKEFSDRVFLKHARFDEALTYLKANNIKANFLLADLGISSWQLDDAKRGFSFMRKGPLDMRMNNKNNFSVIEFLNTASEDVLRKTFIEYGQEPKSAKIAKFLVKMRKQKKITNTEDLSDLVAVIKKDRKKHPATLIFQSLRILVNDEISQLNTLLSGLPAVLNSKSIAAIISFHSLEDRLVKNFFRKCSQNCICDKTVPVCVCNHKIIAKIITKKAIKAGQTEMINNSRARSARLRAVEFL